MKKRLLSIAICFVMVAVLLAGVALPIYAEEEYDEGNVKLAPGDTTWQENYKYFLNFAMEEIVLEKYKGSEENVVIPSTATVGGVKYNVRLNNDSRGMFSDCENVKTVDFSALNTGNVTDTSVMFWGCSNLTSIVGLDTHNVTRMDNMFRRCFSLEEIPDINTSNVTIMSDMFNGCAKLKSIDASKIDTHNAQYMDYMFGGAIH